MIYKVYTLSKYDFWHFVKAFHTRKEAESYIVVNCDAIRTYCNDVKIVEE